MQKTMLAVMKEKAQAGVTLKQIPIPTPINDEILVKVLYASICGTDIGIYNWTPWAAGHIKPPIVIGHEVVGEVVELGEEMRRGLGDGGSGRGRSGEGGIGGMKIGDIVSSETHIYCGNCYQCRIGNLHVCENMELFGIGRNGGFAEYTTIPIRTTWKNNLSIPLEAMSVAEPLGNAVHVITKANVAGKKVLVVGLGPTGLCAGMVAKAYGAREVVGLNRSEYRRKLGKKVGLDRVIEKLSEREYNLFDVVVEMSGSQAGIQIAFDAVRIAGKVIAFGIPKSEITLNWGKYLINKELSIDSVFGRRIWETWYQTSDLLTSGKIDLTKIITHRFKLDQFEEAMKVMMSGECGKVLLEVA
ncbi:hypothetical protein A3D80_01605 [Candidatus Roizmanbacteria bacterium RIFCSPHIGHO2_02_FULL_40_13b]|uniref:L-threonine 3-dehydrogenase n=1 Tax=Candidatus Roizmanbacteria bacterium RIFCSPHIGHO2_01_FULL_39_24 TaxID=1802032 RepID=A0A1F7GGE2_9BACT|nr:MAG: hypothetical protein A2799_00920 [Candidatus Roizmanbacteria bacterium RIFCSPHIGHO2_01_FULL_39_24]OGK26820.1 MAG: hypothetical protein A3D80_01605 [Candidatus Roizmanbacteria bacterium RIFCSPHIGHO2_02_FULL_40_13b]OGK48743.1 MAG: hypothetical protein A3A56_03140 [Candidatus Roizmanbacteria bacterium RIFCSPLOWO2_01_FULL_40_32]